METESGEILSFVDACDFEIVSDEHNVLNNKQAIVRCVQDTGRMDLQVGKTYIALKQDKTKRMFYVLDDSSDCYYYPKALFIVLEDEYNLLGN